MKTTHTCYSAEELARYWNGEAEVDVCRAIEQHLAECSLCLEQLAAIETKDSFCRVVESACAQPTPEAFPDVDAEIFHQRFVRLAGNDTPLSGIASGETQTSCDPTTISAESLAFLAPPQQPGELGRLGQFRILEILGRGGMGIVFRAEEIALRRQVALKVMLPKFAGDAEAKERFLREARSAATVENYHVVPIYFVGEDHGVPFLSMQLLQGETLESRINREGTLTVAASLRIASQIAEGLAGAHERGVIHRDIKPANVWLKKGTDNVVLLDFGLARPVDGDGQISSAHVVVGTPAFMSPEQADGDPVDARSDLFSLGCVLYRMCTGQLPFPGSKTMQILRAVAELDPAPPVQLNPRVSSEVSELVMRLLAKRAADRPISAQQVALQLREFEGVHAITPKAVAITSTAVTPVRWRPVWLMVIGLLSLVVGGLAYFFGGIAIDIATNKGRLTIVADDRDIEVTIKKQGDKPLIEILDRQTKRQLELTAGDYDIEVKEKNGFAFNTRKLTLNRGGREILKVELVLAKAAPANLDANGFVSLFNGKDLGGWKTYDPKQQEKWFVKDGILYSSGEVNSHLFSPRGDYENFHFRIEAKISDGGNSGQYFRTRFGPGYPEGYEAQINSTFPDPQKTGSLYGFVKITEMLVPPDTWFTQEVIANGNHIQILVNGKKAVDYKDEKNTYTRGHLAIQQHGRREGGRETQVAIKKIEVKELPPATNKRDTNAPFAAIFNGKDLTGWKLRGSTEKNQWIVGSATIDDTGKFVFKKDGADLVNRAAGGIDIYTEQEFGDCRVECEVMVPKGSNSGIYLMGRYEIQILDSFGREKLGMDDMGAIFSVAAPKLNACLKAGEWQKYVIDFQAPRFDGKKKTTNAIFKKVELNGKVIHENVEMLSGVTAGSISGSEASVGPLMFQGDHSQVVFRNVRIAAGNSLPALENKAIPFTDLFNGKSLAGWKAFVADGADAAKTFSVKDGMIVVSGKPNGYLYTEKTHRDYVIQFDWRYPRPANLKNDDEFNGNSGLFVHIQEPHQIWPKAIEVQGQNKDHGKIFATRGAKGEFSFDADALKKARKAVGEWNTTEVSVRGGEIVCKVNGAQVSTGKTDLTEGALGIQSEGAEIHLKNIRLRAHADQKAATSALWRPIPLGQSPLDNLDPSAIPPEERFDWQPKELVAVLGSHRQRLWFGGDGVTISGDGTQVVGRYSEFLLNFESGKMTDSIPVHAYPAFSHDGKWLFDGWDRIVDLTKWSEARKKGPVDLKDVSLPIKFAHPGGDYVINAQFSADSTYLVLHKYMPRRVALFRISKEAQRIAEWPGFNSPALSLDGKTLVLRHIKDQKVQMFCIEGDQVEPRGELPVEANNPRGLHFAHDGRLALIAEDGKSVSFWDLAGAKPEKTGSVSVDLSYGSFRFAAKAPRMVTSDPHSFTLWKLTERGAERESTGHNFRFAAINGLAISADGNRLVSGHRNGAIAFWEVKEGTPVERNPLQPQPAESFPQHGANFHFSPTGEYLTSIGEAGTTVWHFGGKSPTGALPAQLQHPTPSAPFFGKDLFVTAVSGIQAWRVTPTALKQMGERTLPAHAENPLASAETGLVVARYWRDNEKPAKSYGLVLDMNSPNATAGASFEIGGRPSGGPPAAALSADGRLFASVVASPDNETDSIRAFDLHDGRPTKRYDVETKGWATSRMRLSRDGKWLVAGGSGWTAMWRLDRDSAEPHRRDIGAGSFSPDGKSLVAVFGRKLEIRDVESWDLLWRIGLPNGMGMNDAIFAADGRHLLVANGNQTAYILRLDPKIFEK